jgi:hypothetical protein
MIVAVVFILASGKKVGYFSVNNVSKRKRITALYIFPGNGLAESLGAYLHTNAATDPFWSHISLPISPG